MTAKSREMHSRVGGMLSEKRDNLLRTLLYLKFFSCALRPTLLRPNFFCAHLMCSYSAFHLPCYSPNFFLRASDVLFVIQLFTYPAMPLIFFHAHLTDPTVLYFFLHAPTLLCLNFFHAQLPCCALVLIFFSFTLTLLCFIFFALT